MAEVSDAETRQDMRDLYSAMQDALMRNPYKSVEDLAAVEERRGYPGGFVNGRADALTILSNYIRSRWDIDASD